MTVIALVALLWIYSQSVPHLARIILIHIMTALSLYDHRACLAFRLKYSCDAAMLSHVQKYYRFKSRCYCLSVLQFQPLTVLREDDRKV